jgi:hypothetical protein
LIVVGELFEIFDKLRRKSEIFVGFQSFNEMSMEVALIVHLANP